MARITNGITVMVFCELCPKPLEVDIDGFANDFFRDEDHELIERHVLKVHREQAHSAHREAR